MKLSLKLENLETTSLKKALERPPQSDLISFDLGMPCETLFPLEYCQTRLTKIWKREFLQYSLPAEKLKSQIVKIMQYRGVSCTPSEVFLTTGAQQAIFLLTMVLAKKYDHVLADRVTYPGFIQVAKLLELDLSSAKIDYLKEESYHFFEDRDLKKRHPKFYYTIPEGHNPLGKSLSKVEREKLIEMASHYKIPIIEDDPYGFINYDIAEPALKSLSKNWVYYIGSFSKIFAPSIRVGWIVGPEKIIKKLEFLKSGVDVNTSTITQRIVCEFLRDKNFYEYLLFIRRHYQQKRDKMVKALNQYVPNLNFIEPSSGFFIWATLPQYFDAQKLFFNASRKQRVSFLPGSVFDIETDKLDSCLSIKNSFRLSYSHCSLELIESGIQRLAEALKEYRI